MMLQHKLCPHQACGCALLSLQVERAFASTAALGSELQGLQHSIAALGGLLAGGSGRPDLGDARRQLESTQQQLGLWEEALAGQLELITELQSPSRRNSMLASTRRSRMGPAARSPPPAGGERLSQSLASIGSVLGPAPGDDA